MVMILMLIAFMFPAGSSDHASPTHSIRGSSSRSHHSSSASTSASSTGNYVYNIVLDAGSTGSRIHIFKFKQVGKQLQLQSDGFHQLKPGLSSFEDNPQAAADSLKPLMEEALKAVPNEQQVRSLVLVLRGVCLSQGCWLARLLGGLVAGWVAG